MTGTIAASLALLRAILVAVVPGVEVVQAPDAKCPSMRTSARPSVREGEAPDGERTFRLLLERAGDVARVDLRDPAGRSVLLREVSLPSSDCGIVADAIALIVERYFRDLTSSPAPAPEPAPAAVTASPTSTTAADAPVIVRAPVPVVAGPALRRLPRFVLGVGPAFWTRNTSLALALDARVRVRGALHVGVATLLPPFHASSDLGNGGATAQSSGVPVIFSVGAARSFGRLALAANGSGLLTFEEGQTAGISAPASAWRAVLALGLGVSGTWRLAERVRLEAGVAGYRAAFGRSYVVEGVPGDVLEPAPWQAIVTLGVELIVSP